MCKGFKNYSQEFAEFGTNYTLVTNDGLELHDSAGTQSILSIGLKLVQDLSSINILHNCFCHIA